MEKILQIVKDLINQKFSGDVIITFNQGGVRAVKKARYDNL
jgi:hypothetical protein